MIQLIEMEGRDFLSFGKFSMKLENLGLVSIKGENIDSSAANSNGAGKSSIFEFIHWVIYGNSLRGISKSEIVRRESDNGCWGKLKFRCYDSSVFVIERYYKDSEYRNNLYLYEEGVEDREAENLRGESKAETQGNVLKKVGISSDLFRQICLFGQGGLSRFSSLGDSEKKKLLEEILQISVYDEAAVLSRKKAAECKRKVDVLTLDSTRNLDELSRIKELYESFLAEKDEWAAKIMKDKETLLLKIQDKEREYHTIGRGIEASLPDIDEGKLDKANKELKGVVEERHGIMTRFEGKKHELLFAKQKEGMLRDQKEEQLKELDQLLFDETCPTCKQSVDSKTLPDFDALRGQAFAHKQKIAKLDKVLSDLESAKTGIFQELDERKESLESMIESMNTMMIRKKRQDKMQESKIKERDQCSYELNKLKELLTNWKDTVYPHLEKIDELNKYVMELKVKCKRLSDDLFKAKRQSDQLGVLGKVFGPQGIRSFLFENLIPEFNVYLKKYSDIISSGQLVASLRSQSETAKGELREKINLVIETTTSEVSYDSCSFGERRRLDLPIAFALQDIAAARGVGLGVCLLDEVFEHVDESGIFGMMELLKEISRRPFTNTVLLITHDIDLACSLPSSIRVQKVNGVSSVLLE